MRLIPLVVLLAACAGPQNEKDKRDKYGRTEELAARYAAAVERRELVRGMHQDEVEVVMRGRPEKVSRQQRNDNTYTVWEYRSKSLDLYFDRKGFLMDWRGPY